METKLEIIDLDAEGAPLESVLADVTKLNKLEIVEYNSKAFRADVTGQKGTFEYVVRGVERNYSLGADTVIQVSLETKLKPVSSDLKAFVASEHYTKLRSAKKRQLKKRAKLAKQAS